MDKFILKNDTWLRYLPIIMYGLVILIILMLIIMGFLIYKKYKNQNLRSHNGRSAFAMAYAETATAPAISSAPRSRAERRPETSDAPQMAPPPPPQQMAPPPQAEPPQQMTPPPQMEPQASSAGAAGQSVLEFYFQYEEDYKI